MKVAVITYPRLLTRLVTLIFLGCFFVSVGVVGGNALGDQKVSGNGPVIEININGPINPATDDYLRTALASAETKNARLLIVRLNTPGGLVNSMQTMVQGILDSPVPVVVYVSPAGASATSAGVFITLAGHVAVMAPGTTIGAAHPVDGSGDDIQGDMRKKVENFAVSLIKAIAEQRQRNVQWAEKAVRESVSITDRDALAEKVIDFVASDLDRVLEELEGRTVTVRGQNITLHDLKTAPRESIEMSLKQRVVNFLADPNITILLGLGAMLGIGIELYHPGAILPGVVGVICLVLSLGSAQVIPINSTGLILLLLSAAFFVGELLAPSFGVWGGAGVICLVLGSIYLIDQDQVFGFGHYGVDRLFIGTIAACVGSFLLFISFVALRAQRRKVITGREGLVGMQGVVREISSLAGTNLPTTAKVFVRGEIWNARFESDLVPASGDTVEVQGVEPGMILRVKKV